ncbi:MAG TPA: hypothetical protein PLE74_01175 [Candidatus Cloacimonadota bacterium]|nr:hypothetical protein [Candidatus Cloacimonadota bacterium]
MILFSYDTYNLILPNPQYGEAKIVNVKTMFDHAMDGKIYSFRYTPPADKFELPIKGVMGSKKDEVIEFLKASAGQILVYTDEFGTEHNVRVISDPIEFTCIGRGYNNMYAYDFTITLEKI